MENFGSSSLSSTKVDSEDPYRLLESSSKGDVAGVIQELEKGVEPDAADYDRRTALHLAACEGWTEVVVLLLEKGANVNSLDRWGRTPLSDARSFGRHEICKKLEAHGGVDPVGVDSQTPCFEICYTEVCMDEATLIAEGGKHSEFYLVKWRGTEVVAKTICSSIASNPKAKNIFMKELALWQRLRHPNIVQFLGVLDHSDRLTFLTEYLRNGSLYDILKRKGRLHPETAIAYALDIARGMNFPHQHKPHTIIHRDLSPRCRNLDLPADAQVISLHFVNQLGRHACLGKQQSKWQNSDAFIMLTHRNVLQDEAGHLKVTDFGLSKIAQKKDSYRYKMTGGTGSYRYMAPEVYRRESYGKSIDVFSFSLIVYEMFQGGPSTRGEIAELVAERRAYEDSRPPLPSYIYPEPIKTLLRKCWHKNPDCRPTFEEIISQLEVIQQNLKNEKAMKASRSCIIL